MSWVSRHSNDAGLAATRGGAIRREGAVASPASVNSSTSAGTIAALAFIASARARVARFQVNSRVAAMLATLSFHPIDEKAISGGA